MTYTNCFNSVAAAPDLQHGGGDANKPEGKSKDSLGVPFVYFPHLSLEEPQIDQKFRDVLRIIAGRSDLELKTPAHMLNDKLNLRLEQFTQRKKFVSLTTNDAVKQFVEAWWVEFQKSDVTTSH